MGRSEYQAASCDVSPVEIFTPGLSEHERRRERIMSEQAPRVNGVVR
jgi:hypothetical protein